MITMSTKTINLDLISRGVVDTGLFFKQHDNKVATFNFNVEVDDTPITYSEVNKALLIIYFQDKTTLEPILCTVEDDKITQVVNNAMLSKVGTVDGFLRLYSDDEQVLTTNSFRYTVDEDVFKNEGITEDVSLLNQALEEFIEHEAQENLREQNESVRKFNENSRIANESTRSSNELSRISAEDTRSTSESTRVTQESERQSNEDIRISNETNRINSFNTMTTEIEAFKNSLSDSILSDIQYNSNGLNGSSDNITDRILLSVPTGYKYIVNKVDIISHGNNSGLTDVNTFQVLLENDTIMIATKTFNDITAFPSNNSIDSMTISNSDINQSENISLTLINSDGVIIPEFTVNINYKIVKL